MSNNNKTISTIHSDKLQITFGNFADADLAQNTIENVKLRPGIQHFVYEVNRDDSRNMADGELDSKYDDIEAFAEVEDIRVLSRDTGYKRKIDFNHTNEIGCVWSTIDVRPASKYYDDEGEVQADWCMTCSLTSYDLDTRDENEISIICTKGANGETIDVCIDNVLNRIQPYQAGYGGNARTESPSLQDGIVVNYGNVYKWKKNIMVVTVGGHVICSKQVNYAKYGYDFKITSNIKNKSPGYVTSYELSFE